MSLLTIWLSCSCGCGCIFLWGRHDSSYEPTDPTIKWLNKLCNPYGQGGKPLYLKELDDLHHTVHSDWKVETNQDGEPLALTNDYEHPDFMVGARFLQKIAAVAQINAHFPLLYLEQRIVKKNWQVVSVVHCHTKVLGRLSAHDFHLAMVSLNSFWKLLIYALLACCGLNASRLTHTLNVMFVYLTWQAHWCGSRPCRHTETSCHSSIKVKLLSANEDIIMDPDTQEKVKCDSQHSIYVKVWQDRNKKEEMKSVMPSKDDLNFSNCNFCHSLLSFGLIHILPRGREKAESYQWI